MSAEAGNSPRIPLVDPDEGGDRGGDGGGDRRGNW
eukprot:CAMPEP_0180787524 /NCGR_PEP_ID=MMETSP1038_2-20121128/51434_1 /TAXON_ID=632150 /ORGANISM="Azadinium spinosum, Strain 3D9" /LENGTH=34 /DNA_ID= /DNA_START= /DNA_END= /DNA_ORIENTATION=